MKIYLARHGESVPTGADNERPLNEKGKEDVQRLAKFIAPLHIQVTQIFHSEKIRAQKTAEILLSSITSQTPPQIKLELDPLGAVDHIINQFSSWPGDTLLVGHMPFMGKLVGKLVTNNENKNVIAFKAGSLICLEQSETNEWIICWMLTPHIFF